MGHALSDRELKRVSREMSGHRKDKDRARWKRKVGGQAAPMKTPLPPPVEESEPEEPEPDDEQ